MSAARARRFVSQALSIGEVPGADADASLLVSELVTNAVLHARTSIEVDVRVSGGQVRVNVHDAAEGDARPQPAPPSEAAATGRGTQLLDELADVWGADVHGGGKVVWFELHDQQQESRPALRVVPIRSAQGAPGSAVDVVLLHVPVDAAARAIAHHDELLRELALVSLAPARAPHLPQRLLDLADGVRERFGAFTQPLRAALAAAGERGEWTCDVTVHLPAELRAATVELAALHAEADGLSRAGALLTLPPPDDVVLLRGWLMGQLAAQLGGAAPVAYPVAVSRRRAS